MYTLKQIEEIKEIEKMVKDLIEENKKLKERVVYLEKVMYNETVDNEDYEEFVRDYSMDDYD